MIETLAARLIADPDRVDRHETVIPAPPETVWTAFRRDSAGSRMLRCMSAARLLGTDVPALRPASFVLLAEEPRPSLWWTYGGPSNDAGADGPERFLAFAEPGYERSVVSVRFLDAPGGATRLVVETRSERRTASAELVRPVSVLIRAALVRSLARRSLARGNGLVPARESRRACGRRGWRA